MFSLHRYLLLTLDPLHVGTGGYRLGRVDLSIVREPGTGVPKIPGTSLSGAARAYAAQRAGQLGCAGQGQPGAGREGHCGRPACPICYTFGSLFSRDEEGQRIQRAHAGAVNLSDARLLFFPVATAAGPVWVTTQERLAAAGFPTEDLTQPGAEEVLLTFERSDALNLGWLLLDTGGPVMVAPPGESGWGQLSQWQAIAGRIGLVQESLFGQVVNANLEVRTSVSIDPITGAAEEGALFTYEALPRAAWLLGEIIVDDYRRRFPSDKGAVKGVGTMPLAVVETGLKLVEYLGIGGMGTRGFGRAQMIGQPWLVTQGPEVAT
jgi:CRISPR-associated protein Cmr4